MVAKLAKQGFVNQARDKTDIAGPFSLEANLGDLQGEQAEKKHKDGH
jgi:hypothetical protein